MPEEKLAKATPSGIVPADMDDLVEIMNENMGEDGIDPSDLTQVRVPTGGATNWTIATLDGDASERAVEGVIVAWKTIRAYWKSPYGSGGTNAPPDCKSDDGRIGAGDPGGECKSCPYAQFGSEIRPDNAPARGQACKLRRLLFVLREGHPFPVVVVAPATSVKELKSYFFALSSEKRLRFWQAVTRLTLVSDKNADNIKYSKIVPEFIGPVPPADISALDNYRRAFLPVVESVSYGHISDDESAQAEGSDQPF